MNKVSIDIGITGDANKKLGNLSSGFASLGGSIGGMLSVAGGMFVFNAINGIFSSFTDTLRNLTNTIGSLVNESLDISRSFGASMKGVQAVLGGTAEDFKNLSDRARELGSSTVWTAREVSSGMEMLARNGLNMTDILNGAIDATLSLASANATDLSTAADIATDAMLQFNRSAEDLPKIVDIITGVTVTSKFAIEDYAYALANAGGSAASLGVSFEDLNTMISLTSSYFSSGMTAGTAFRTFLARLVPQSKEAAAAQKELNLQFFEADGSMKSMRDITGQLQRAFSKLSDEQKNNYATTLFGTEGMRFALATAAQGVDTFDNLAESIGNVSAATQAQIRLEGMAGALTLLDSAAEGFKLQFGTVIDQFIESSGIIGKLQDGFGLMEEFFQGFGDRVSERTPEITAAFGGLWEKIQELLVALGLMGEESVSAFDSGENAADLFVNVLLKLIEKATEFIDYLILHKDDIKEGFRLAQKDASDFLATLNSIKDTVAPIIKQMGELWAVSNRFLKLQDESGILGGTGLGGVINGLRAIGGGMNGGFIRGFQTGGYVSGPRIGTGRDNILVRAEKDEVILNKKQQKNIMGQLDKQGITINNNFQSYVDPEVVASRLAFQLNFV